ncbi:FkbM family methyltransferase [Sphingomonas cannabina]|uniref:FkbM family methyltransferase n=1 Tax=Sphingomonas cannabina TaxID=2899123 RepID=UPI001F158760|nr:FkbM family methyltransferase [Sphingomonas cannabina]UIJ45789.1 FkbM family methyltransferase [Sphingomonas cannabina]
MSIIERASRRVARGFGYELKRVLDPGAASVNMLAHARDLMETTAPETRAFLSFCLTRLSLSKSQILQDLFALYETGEKRSGYFVEFGATDGIVRSNSFMLETEFGWTGIVAEPARAWHEALDRSRRCAVDHRCVTDRSGEAVTFTEVGELELSSIEQYSANDDHALVRRGGRRYAVETVSLNDLLHQHGAPGDIDYLSVDTEGSELAILSALDFDAWRPRVITVEHNFSPMRDRLFALLAGHGYVRKFTDLSQMDDWYVRAD